MNRIGVLALARATFDVDFAAEKAAMMWDRLVETGASLEGSPELLLDLESGRAALAALLEAEVERIIVLQVTFTDASLIKEIAGAGPSLAIWAPPEPRTGERLRLNAFCGLHLASHAASKLGRPFAWAYADPASIDAATLWRLFAEPEPRALGADEGVSERAIAHPEVAEPEIGAALAASLSGKVIAKVGAHPDGFDSCAYDAGEMKRRYGLEVRPVELARLFGLADGASDSSVGALRAELDGRCAALAEQQPESLDRSLRLDLGLRALGDETGADAFALRCWPETFTEHGGAICASAALSGDRGVPCACEADVMGAASQLLLRAAAQDAVFLVDLVDVDPESDSAVIWHCGQAPLSMAAETPRATVHSNRGLPLLFEFRLKPGPITLMRISASQGRASMILAGGEVLDEPLPFSGTAAVARFDRPAGEILERVIETGLEHHVAIAYGEHRPALRSAARALGLEAVEL